MRTATWSNSVAPGVAPMAKFARPSGPVAEAGSTPKVTRATRLGAADAGSAEASSSTTTATAASPAWMTRARRSSRAKGAAYRVGEVCIVRAI